MAALLILAVAVAFSLFVWGVEPFQSWEWALSDRLFREQDGSPNVVVVGKYVVVENLSLVASTKRQVHIPRTHSPTLSPYAIAIEVIVLCYVVVVVNDTVHSKIIEYGGNVNIIVNEVSPGLADKVVDAVQEVE